MKMLIMKHNNKTKTIKSSKAQLHIEIVWEIVERYNRRYSKLLDYEELCDEVVDKK